jgi:hypothetical protein
VRPRPIGIVAILALALFAAAAGLYAQAPVREEQLIYSILAFNGKDYAGTFARQDADTIYLMANVDNFLTVRKTLVYFWPITQDWKTDTSGLNIPFEGTLELTARGQEPRSLETTKYTYFNVRGEYALNWQVAKGEEADAAWKRYQDIMGAYWTSVQKYYQERAAYEEMLNQLTATITKLRDAGKDVSALIETLKSLKAPPEPEYPKDYVVPPTPVQQAFILNLPVGEYSLRFLTKDGQLMQDSERKLVVFAKRRAAGVGLEVIPGDKWTRPVESKTPASVLYVDGSADLYLRPFFEEEYNDLYYEKMLQNDAKGNPNLMSWVRIQQVPKAHILVRRPGQGPQTVQEEPFYVEQIKGAALGYHIVPYDPQGAHKGREPSLIAFHIPLQGQEKVLRLRVQDKGGTVLPGSERQIRVIGPSGAGFVPLILAVVPLIVMGVVLARRSRKYSS